MRIKKGLAAAAVGAGLALSATACTGGGGYQPMSDYCVNQAGQVEPSYYCQPSYPDYMDYFVYAGYLHGYSYHVGMVIPHTYIVHGTYIRANNTAARAKAGLSTSFTNGAKYSTPAKAQAAPSSKVSTGTSSKSTSTSTSVRTTTRSTSGFSSSTRSSGGFSSSRSGGFSSSRSSFGGRK